MREGACSPIPSWTELEEFDAVEESAAAYSRLHLPSLVVCSYAQGGFILGAFILGYFA